MKQLVVSLVMIFSLQAQAADVEIAKSKDWRADQLESHKVSEKGACVAQTQIKDKDTYLEVYAEANEQGGFVEPMVQIVSTELPPALGVMFKADNVKEEFPMTISLKETKEIEIEVQEEGAAAPVKKKVEQQVFVGKFSDKEEMIRWIRARNRITAKFFDASGEVAQEQFSLRGSSKTIRTMFKKCL